MKKVLVLTFMIMCMICLCACGGAAQDEEVNITLNDVIEANRMDVLMEEHDSIFVKQENVDINGFVTNTEYWYFAKEDGRMTGDSWTGSDEETAVSNAKDGMICDLYGESLSVTIVPEADYNNRVVSLNPLTLTESDELKSVVKEEDEFIATTIRNVSEWQIPTEVEYHLDEKTLQINRMQVSTYDAQGLKLGIVAMSVKYGGKEEPDRSAWEAVHEPEDNSFCEVTVVMEPGTKQEEKHTIKVAKSCEILVSGEEDYSLYRDEACQTILPVVDTTGSQVTVYAKAVQ